MAIQWLFCRYGYSFVINHPETSWWPLFFPHACRVRSGAIWISDLFQGRLRSYKATCIFCYFFQASDRAIGMVSLCSACQDASIDINIAFLWSPFDLESCDPSSSFDLDLSWSTKSCFDSSRWDMLSSYCPSLLSSKAIRDYLRNKLYDYLRYLRWPERPTNDLLSVSASRRPVFRRYLLNGRIDHYETWAQGISACDVFL